MLFTKIMQTSGKRACSCLPECRLSYLKIMKGECNGKTGNIGFPGLDTAEPPLILSKDNANERQKTCSCLPKCRLSPQRYIKILSYFVCTG